MQRTCIQKNTIKRQLNKKEYAFSNSDNENDGNITNAETYLHMTFFENG